MSPTTMDTFNLGCGGSLEIITLACTHISKQVKFKTSLQFYSKFPPSKTTFLVCQLKCLFTTFHGTEIYFMWSASSV